MFSPIHYICLFIYPESQERVQRPGVGDWPTVLSRCRRRDPTSRDIFPNSLTRASLSAVLLPQRHPYHSLGFLLVLESVSLSLPLPRCSGGRATGLGKKHFRFSRRWSPIPLSFVHFLDDSFILIVASLYSLLYIYIYLFLLRAESVRLRNNTNRSQFFHWSVWLL